ncbi:hypothetical protein [Halococcus sp. PRR34]|uniref:hypothetical protein n=1 Tax=Halococcus sp. PRR34 TaxID=3020830 RepID=UPI00235F2D63|nr:hypothetical protein [Halococcus sp. PRR34]
MTPDRRDENGALGANAELAACERYPLERVPDDHHDEWWLDARVTEQIDVGDGFGTVEAGTPVEIKSAAWRISNGGPRRGRWLLRERAHDQLREVSGEYALLVADPDDTEIAACALRPAWWVEDLVTTWSPASAQRSGRHVAQIPWSRVFEESDEKGIASISVTNKGGATS